ncbi:MAG: hypothetical protein OEY97_11575 [Nitrospirota bacterium]|nr:hypothetical protein [Nitrospirota bacterium]
MDKVISIVLARVSSALSEQRGAILVIALWMLVLMAAMGATGVMLGTTEMMISGNHRAETEAVTVAEAGLMRFVGRVNENPSWPKELVRTGQTDNAFSAAALAATTLPGFTTPPDNVLKDSTFTPRGTYQVRVFPDDPVQHYYRVVSTATLPGDNATEISVEGILRTVPYQAWSVASLGCSNSNMQASAGGSYVVVGDMLAYPSLNMGGNSTSKVEVQGNVSVIGTVSIAGDSTGPIMSRIVPTAAGSGGNLTATGGVTVTNLSEVTNQVMAPALKINGTGSVIGSFVQSTPVLVNYCAPARLSRSIPTFEAIDGYIETAKLDGLVMGGASGWKLTNNDIIDLNKTPGDNTTGQVFFAPAGFSTTNKCNPCQYKGHGVIITTGAVSFSGSLLPVDPLTDRLTIIVRDGSNVGSSGSAATPVVVDIRGVIQVGAVNNLGSLKVGGNFDVGNNSRFEVYGSVFVLKGVTTNNSGGHLYIEFSAVDNSAMFRKYEVGQWRRCAYNATTTRCI